MHARCGLSRVTAWCRVATFAHGNRSTMVSSRFHARADELEQRARKATAAWAHDQCLVSAGLWRSLAKEAEARDMAAHNLDAAKIRGQSPTWGARTIDTNNQCLL